MYKRIVVKIGTGVLSDAEGQLDERVMRQLVRQIVELRKKGAEVVLITSGAVGAGKSILAKDGAQSPVVQKQLYAAVGQVKLMTFYAQLFGEHGYLCAQVLATKEDFRDGSHYENMKNCLNALLPDGVVPIVNENDVVATTELMFTDNDELAGLVAQLLQADALVILTSTDGILDASGNTFGNVSSANASEVLACITPAASSGGRGGMRTKFNIALELSQKGIDAYIANGKADGAVVAITEGSSRGTKFAAV